MRDVSVTERPEVLYFEDHIPGSVYTFGSILVDEKAIVDFASQYDPQSIILPDFKFALATSSNDNCNLAIIAGSAGINDSFFCHLMRYFVILFTSQNVFLVIYVMIIY